MDPSRQKLEVIFDAALDLAAAEREIYLARVCGADAELRGQVERLLRALDRAGNFLAREDNEGRPVQPSSRDAPPGTVPAGSENPPTVTQFTLLEGPGTLIGRYKLLEKLGEGGFGEVWMAEQREPVRRRVALKIIKLGMDTRQIVARFEAERQALALMDHPHIAKVLDAGATDAGRPYFVMELVRGVRLTTYCDQNRLPTPERLDLFIKVCHAIQHAHQKGIIHRDIKPSNILVTLHDGVPVPKVIDFGIAKATQQELTDKTLFTQFQHFIGTPAYISPEQAEMSGLDIDTRSDIYSLGVLLYELLVGKTPFDTKELMQGGLDALRQMIREKEPVRPSTKLNTLLGEDLTTTAKRRRTDALKLVQLLRGDLDWIVMKCLEKDRTRRYDTANGLAMDIQRYLGNEAVLARPPSAAYRFRKMVRRNKLAFVAAALVAGALVAGAIVSLWQARLAKNEADRATNAEQKQKQLLEATDKALASEQRQHLVAEQQRRLAEQRARELRLQLYVSDMSVAWQALQDQQFATAQELLRRYLHRQPGEEDLRGFEWQLIWQQSSNNHAHSLAGHTGMVTCAVFSPDGTWLATADQDREVIVWDVATRRPQKKWGGFDGSIETKALAFSPDGRWLAAKSGTLLHVWQTATWQLSATLPNVAAIDFHNDNAVVFSPDSSALATRVPGGVAFWSTKTWQTNGLFLPGTFALGQVMTYSSDGRFLAVSDSGKLQIRDAHQPTNVLTNLNRGPETNPHRILSVAISADYVAAGYRDGILVLWRRSNWEQVAKVNVNLSYLVALAFSPDGLLLAAGGWGDVIPVWTVESLLRSPGRTEAIRPQTTFRGHTGSIFAAAFAPDGHTLASASADGTVKLWNVPGDAAGPNLAGAVYPIGFSADGQRLVAFHADGRLHTWDVANRFEIPPPVEFLPKGQLWWDRASSGRADRVSVRDDMARLALTPDGKQFAFGLTNGSIQLWQMSPPLLLRELAGDGNPIELVQFSPEAQPQHLLVVSRNGNRHDYRLHDLASNTANPPTRLLESDVYDEPAQHFFGKFGFSADGNLLAVLDGKPGIALFDLRNGSPARRLGAESKPFTCIALSPDGARLAAGELIGPSVWMWDVRSRSEQPALALGPKGVVWLAFSADGKTLLTCDRDNITRFWNVALGKEILTVANYSPMQWGIWFAPRGNALALQASGEPRRLGSSVELFTVPTLKEIDAEQARIERNLKLSNEDIK